MCRALEASSTVRTTLPRARVRDRDRDRDRVLELDPGPYRCQ